VYLKFAQDNYYFENLAHMTNSEYIDSQVTFNAFEYASGDDSNGRHVVCPIETVFDGVSKCLINPYKEFIVVAKPLKTSEESIEITWSLEILSFLSTEQDFDPVEMKY
jgi:hypothetical protein